jgi:hypothetical protein
LFEETFLELEILGDGFDDEVRLPAGFLEVEGRGVVTPLRTRRSRFEEIVSMAFSSLSASISRSFTL